jgi:DNA polymerase
MAKRSKSKDSGGPGKKHDIPDLIRLLTVPDGRPVHQTPVQVFTRSPASPGESFEPIVEKTQSGLDAPNIAVAPEQEAAAGPRPGPLDRKTSLSEGDSSAEENSPPLAPKKVAVATFDAAEPLVKNEMKEHAGDIDMKCAKDSFEKIREDGLKCTACSLYTTRTNFVFGEGNPHAKLVFIGEAPGEEEDLSGRPFVGRAGRHLDKILVAAGFTREEVFICNILKDRPPNNRTPTTAEMQACTPLLRRQLALMKPKIIGLLGNTAVKFVLGPDALGITKIHGQWFDSIFGIPCMPMYHPSYLLRNQSRERGSPNWEMWQDIQALKKKYDEL